MTPAPGSDELTLIRSGLEHDARLTPAGRSFTDRFLQRLVDGATAIDTAFAEDPTIAAERIVEPIFVIGAPRTGTTALPRLLAAAPRHRRRVRPRRPSRLGGGGRRGWSGEDEAP